MNDYIQVDFKITPCSEIEVDILDALLSDANFESFVPQEDGVSAYVQKELYCEENIINAINSYPFNGKITWKSTEIEGQDWNAEWEKNYFQPMVVQDKCVIHASHHKDYPKVEYDITIDPKMAFGTGYHSTTSLMIGELLNIDLENKQILDMGTGTGILAILSAMRGAKATAVEIDEYAYTNAQENIVINNVAENVNVIHGDASSIKKDTERFDILLANINRNIILNDFKAYANALKSGGTMLLSGFYSNEVPILVDKANELGLTEMYYKVDKDWTLLALKKN